MAAVNKRPVTVYTCERCEHEWIPRDALAPKAEQELPTICPKCKSPYWNKKRQKTKAKKSAGRS